MPQVMQQIVIVGGGTAGWLAALYLQHALGEFCAITVIESPNVPTIGVGEATIPTLGPFLSNCGLIEREWMKACSATYKVGIRFENWKCGNDVFFHPFFSGETSTSGSMGAHQAWPRWARLSEHTSSSLAEDCWPETRLIMRRKAPHTHLGDLGGRAPRIGYAWHIDAAQLAHFLRTTVIARGARHLVGHVEDARIREGHLAAVRTAEHGFVEGDFFVDCTGFRRKLMSHWENHFVDFSSELPNDRALAARVNSPNIKRGSLDSCTVARAASAGWIWTIPLFHRFGMGYVYSSQFIDDVEAEREFREALPGEPHTLMRIAFRSGHLRCPWQGNCVAIGLAAGFIEPLESTAIGLTTYGITKLMDYWPLAEDWTELRRRYNSELGQAFARVRDFIVLHYCLNQREDTPYWKAVRNQDRIPSRLQEELGFWQERFPVYPWGEPSQGFYFPEESLACILAGFGRCPRHAHPRWQSQSDADVVAFMDRHEQRLRAVVEQFPDHYRYLAKLHR